MILPWTHILLDLDGTLVKTVDIFHEVDQRFFSRVGITIREDEFRQMQLEDGFNVLTRILNERSVLSPKEKVELMDGILEASLKEIRERISWYEDVEAFVKLSAEKGIVLGIVTRSDPDDLAAMEHRIPVRKLIPVLVHGDETNGKHKPNPYPLLLATQRLNVSPSACLYIGDHQDDITAASNAEMDSCVILRNHVPKILAESADFAISSLSDIYSIPLRI